VKKYSIRPATASDIHAFNDGNPAPHSVRAWAIDYNGTLTAISGLAMTQPRTFFMNIMPGLNPPKLAIWRVSLEIAQRVRELHIPVQAIAETPEAERYLERLGFTYSHSASDGAYFNL